MGFAGAHREGACQQPRDAREQDQGAGLVGALVPLVPFLFVGGSTGVMISAFVTAVALLGVGALTSRVTGRSAWLAAMRMLAIGGAAAVVTYLIGLALGVSVVG